MPQRALPRPLLAHSRGCCQGTHPSTKQRGEAATDPVCAHLTPSRVLRGTAPHGIKTTQGPASQLDRFLLLLGRPQACKAERLPDLELFPSLAQLRPSLSSHTTAEQLSTVSPAPHLQYIPTPNPTHSHPRDAQHFASSAAPSFRKAPAPRQPRGCSRCVQWPGNKWKPWKITKCTWLRRAHTCCRVFLGCDPGASPEALLWLGAAPLPLRSSAGLAAFATGHRLCEHH